MNKERGSNLRSRVDQRSLKTKITAIQQGDTRIFIACIFPWVLSKWNRSNGCSLLHSPNK